MSLQRVPIKDFRGGLNTRDSPFDLQANESPDLLNVTISNLVGQLEARKGKTRLDKEGLPVEEVDFAKQVVIGSAGKRFLMLSINGDVYAMGPTGKVVKLHEGTEGSVWSFEVYADAAFKDWVYMGNGVDVMQKWDGEAAGTVEWKATKGAIPKGGVLCVWENRMFITYVGASSQRLYFSEFGDPEATVAEYGFVDVRGAEEDLDSIQDLHVLGARLIILKRRGIFFISSSVTMLNRHIGGPGVWGRFMCAELENELYFFNPQGIFSTGGVEVKMESGSINNYFPQHLNKVQYEKARLIVTKDTYPRLLLSVATGAATTPDKLIELVPHINFRRIGGRRYLLLPAFFLHTLATTAIACWNPTGDEEIIAGASIKIFNPATEFPVIPLTETLEGEDAVFQANWTQFVAAAEKGHLETFAGIFKSPGYIAWVSEQPEALRHVGALYHVREYSEPAVTFHIRKKSTNANTFVTLMSCMQSLGAVENGYFTTFIWVPATSEWEVKIQRVEAGVVHALGTVKIPNNFEDIGMTVQGGKIRVFVKNIATGLWELVNSAADAKWSKGYVGLQSFGVKWQFQRFAVEETPSGTVARMSSLFEGESDEGEPIESHWQSSWMAIQEQEPKERIRRLNVQLSGDVEVDVFHDFETVPAFTAKLPFKEGSEEGNEYRFARVRPETRGRYHSVRFRNVIGSEPFLINAAELVIRGGKEH